MRIMYLVFGDTLRYHIEANLSIRTFQRQAEQTDSISVLTNRPEYYRRAKVDVIPLDDECMREWSGPHQYKFRIKIKAVEFMCQQYPDEDLLFVDCDTFLYGSLQELKSRLAGGAGLMHKNEGHPSGMSGRALKMWKTMQGRHVGNITISKEHDLWNSGVIGIPADKIRPVVNDWLQLCDDMLEQGVEAFNMEEYALSISLFSHTTLTATDDLVGHYWGNKEVWEKMVSDLMCQAYMKDQTLEEELSSLDMDLLCNTPVYVNRSSRHRQFYKLADKLFPVRSVEYAKRSDH